MNKDKARDPARDALAEIVDGEQAHLPFHLRCQIMVRAARWVDTAVAEARAPLVEALPDPQKLRVLADWIERYMRFFGVEAPDEEVQR